MSCKVKLNVVCSSREKRFLVIAYENWLLEEVKECVEIVFQKLYPDEQILKVCRLQNEFHFDLSPHYTVKDCLTDAGLVFAIEEECFPTNRYSCNITTQPIEENQAKKKLKKKKKSKDLKKVIKRKKANENTTDGSTIDNRVTSTTESPMNMFSKDCKLMPQVVEKLLCEDSEVDVETVEDEYL